MKGTRNHGSRPANGAFFSWRRTLPVPGEVLVEIGQVVRPDTVLANADLPGVVVPVNVAANLSLAPAEVPAALLGPPGTRVAAGEPLARVKSLFGLLSNECLAPCAGVLASVSPRTGLVMIQTDPAPVSLSAFVAGEVAALIPGRGAEIRAAGVLVPGVFGIGGECWGKVAPVLAGPGTVLSERQVSGDLPGKVVVAGGQITAAALRAAALAGAVAVVCGGIEGRELNDFLGCEIGTVVTGGERVGLTLVVTEGFGPVDMDDRLCASLGRFAGRTASVTGATQIRAGARRPEAFFAEAPGSWPAGEETGELAMGDPVRLVGSRFFGARGRVVGLPAERQRVDTGVRMRVIEVELPTGERKIVPRANVERVAGQLRGGEAS